MMKLSTDLNIFKFFYHIDYLNIIWSETLENIHMYSYVKYLFIKF